MTFHLNQQQQYRRIDMMRRGKRWLRKAMIVVVALLILAVALSYVFITKSPEPQEDVHNTLLDRI